VARMLRDRLPAIAEVVLLPWDRSTAMTRWLSAWQPDGVVIVEPEIWPNFYAACARLAVPLLLVNAHMYPSDLRRYRFIRPFVSGALRLPAAIGVQTDRDADAFIALGAPRDRVSIDGSLKFDGAALAPTLDDIDARPLASGSTRQTIVAGSVHASEIAWVLDAFVRLRRDGHRRIIVAPRYAADFETAVGAARVRGLRVARWSERRASGAGWDVLVVDRFGVLAALYEIGDVAFVGGSLVRKGGHNVLEPARCACATVIGPHVDHVAGLVDELEASGGIVRLSEASPAALHEALARLLDEDDRRAAIGAAARRYHAARSGAARRSVVAVTAAVEWRATRATSPHAASAAACCTAAATPLADR
jgi:3-deoxy-D-manno-octulosonic-acid transferase